ncbi:hypothetical protein Leryth_009185 [Lithospermum erythrorhizon]|nr:hypothetical protein Leryth_009185 [Lithospermum erythrorhizon]
MFVLALQNTSCLRHIHELKDVLHRTALQFSDITFSLWSSIPFSTAYASLFFVNGDGSQNNDNDIEKMNSKKPRGFTIRRQWTSVLIAINLLVYAAQVASQGKLLLWGAKVNSLINRGQL